MYISCSFRTVQCLVLAFVLVNPVADAAVNDLEFFFRKKTPEDGDVDSGWALCVPLEVSTCSGLPYTTTIRQLDGSGGTPDFQERANQSLLAEFGSLLTAGCSKHAGLIACVSILPPCVHRKRLVTVMPSLALMPKYVGFRVVPTALQLCSSLCWLVRHECRYKLMRGLKWPRQLDCQNLPDHSTEECFDMFGPRNTTTGSSTEFHKPLSSAVSLDQLLDNFGASFPMTEGPHSTSENLFNGSTVVNETTANVTTSVERIPALNASRKSGEYCDTGSMTDTICWTSVIIVCLCTMVTIGVLLLSIYRRVSQPHTCLLVCAWCGAVCCLLILCSFAAGPSIISDSRSSAAVSSDCLLKLLLKESACAGVSVWWLLTAVCWFLCANCRWSCEAVDVYTGRFCFAGIAATAAVSVVAAFTDQWACSIGGDTCALRALSLVNITAVFLHAAALLCVLLFAVPTLSVLTDLVRSRRSAVDINAFTENRTKLMQQAIGFAVFNVLFVVLTSIIVASRIIVIFSYPQRSCCDFDNDLFRPFFLTRWASLCTPVLGAAAALWLLL